MSNQYQHPPEATNSYDGPTDDELKRIEEELQDILDYHSATLFTILSR